MRKWSRSVLKIKFSEIKSQFNACRCIYFIYVPSSIEAFGSAQGPESTEEVDPQSPLRWCWGSRGPTRVSALPATASNTPSYWRSASAGTDSGSRRCNACQPSGSNHRQRSSLEIKQLHISMLCYKKATEWQKRSEPKHQWNPTWTSQEFLVIHAPDHSLCCALVGPPVRDGRP